MTSSVVAAYLLLVLVYSVDGNASCVWDYEGIALGPDRWSEQFPECGKTSQSPIDIQTSKVIYNGFLRSFDLIQYSFVPSYPDSYTMKLDNGGHTVTLTYAGVSPVVISGGNLPEDYVLDQLHFHWGSCNDSGSEHQIDGKSEVMEMHIVHHKRTLTRESSAQKPDGLAVLAFFFKVGSHNLALDVLIPYIKKVIYKHQQTDVSSFNLYDLLPKEWSPHNYYRYNGSLTTPPCYQTVIWSVFSTKLELSEKQLEVFRALRAETGNEVISDNFRPVQPLNGRLVYSNDPVYLRATTAGPLLLPPPPLFAEYQEYPPPPALAQYHEYPPPPFLHEDPEDHEYPDM